ncbi:hypothetical protein XENORESO_003895 [Xenotaenia resolanae]|uniref:Uncharacterized protein n=1 Tax=Xenotaenia resolanae TaxID=208358 RepID=A0ABV0VWC2_9TELE
MRQRGTPQPTEEEASAGAPISAGSGLFEGRGGAAQGSTQGPRTHACLPSSSSLGVGEDLEDDGISVRVSNSEFQSLENQGDPLPDPRDREGDPPSIGGNDGSGNSLGSSVTSGPREEPCPLRAIILAALAKVDLDDAPVARPIGNPFFRRARRPSWKSFSAAGGILEASPTMVETHGSWRACAILGIMVWTACPLWITASHHWFFPQMRRSGRGPGVQAPRVG